MAKIYGSQRKLGYHEIVYNIKTGKFLIPLPGDNYYELDVQTGSGSGSEGVQQTSGTLPLDNPTREARADSTGLKTQADFNKYIHEYVEEIETSGGSGGFSGDYNDLTNTPDIPENTSELTNDSGFITAKDIPDGFSGDYNDLINQPTIPTDNTELTNGAGYITLDEVPDPVLEGALVFKGNVANEGALPGDASVGEIYFNEEDSHMYAWGEDGQWHKLNTIDDVDLSGYATEDWVEAKGYITADEIPEVNLDGYATEQWVTDKNYITLEDVPDAPEVNLDGYATEQWVTDQNYITLEDVPDAPEVNLDGYATEQWVTDQNYITLEDVPDAPEVNLDEYAKLTDSEQSITAKEFIGDGSKLTNLPIPEGSASVPPLSDVLDQGNIAKFGQVIRFSTSDTPISLPKNLAALAEVVGNIEPGFGKEEGALFKTTYITPEVQIEGDGDSHWLGDEFVNGVYKFETATDTQIWTENPDVRGGSPTFAAGLQGISWEPGKGTDSGHQGRSFWVTPYSVHFESQAVNLLLSDVYGQYEDYGTFTIKGKEARIDTDTGTIEAKEFIGDGSKLTNLPGGAVGINEVLAEGNEADFGQKLIFHTTADDVVPPYTLPAGVDIPDFEVEANYGTFIRGAHTRYQASEPFNYVDGDVDVQVNWALADASPRGFEVKGSLVDKSGEVYYNGSINKFGLRYTANNSTTDNTASYQFGDDMFANVAYGGVDKFFLDVGEHNAELTIDGTITATEFIGDGSKLTNLPTGGNVDLDEYARLDGADFTGNVRTDGLVFTGGLRISNDPLSDARPTGSVVQIDTTSLRLDVFEPNYSNSSGYGFQYQANSSSGTKEQASMNWQGVKLWKDYTNNKDPQVHLSPDGSITAKEFIGDGSKLTNLPVGGETPDLDAVVKAGQEADEHIIAAGFSTPSNTEYNGIHDDESKYRVYAYPDIGLRIDSRYNPSQDSSNKRHIHYRSSPSFSIADYDELFDTPWNTKLESNAFSVYGDGSTQSTGYFCDVMWSGYRDGTEYDPNTGYHAFLTLRWSRPYPDTLTPYDEMGTLVQWCHDGNLFIGENLINSNWEENANVIVKRTGEITAKEFIGDGSKLTNLPTSVLEGALVFKGTVQNEASLPSSGNALGDMWHTTDEDGLYAWGEDDAWHIVGSTTDVDLSEYARLDGAEFTGEVTFTADYTIGEHFRGQELSAWGVNIGQLGVSVNMGNITLHNYGKFTGANGIEIADGKVTATEFIGDGSKLTLTSPNGTKFNLSVADDGTLSATAV